MRRLPHDKALELYEQGKSDIQIGRILGFDTKTVWQWRLKNKLPGKRVYVPPSKKQKIPRGTLAAAMGVTFSVY